MRLYCTEFRRIRTAFFQFQLQLATSVRLQTKTNPPPGSSAITIVVHTCYCRASLVWVLCTSNAIGFSYGVEQVTGCSTSLTTRSKEIPQKASMDRLPMGRCRRQRAAREGLENIGVLGFVWKVTCSGSSRKRPVGLRCSFKSPIKQLSSQRSSARKWIIKVFRSETKPRCS